MNLQVLVSSMNQNDYGLIKKMNIQSDAIIINQCDKTKFDEFEYNGNNIKFLSFNERGIGRSRNNALMRASADICLFADEDVTYVNNYQEIIINAFKENPKADVILFNVPSTNEKRPTYKIKSKSKVRWYNCLKYGAVRMAIKTDKLKISNIYFSLLFGGGAKYGSGEDSLFIKDCIKNKLNIYTNPNIIGYVSQNESSWFEGYNKKFFKDKGALFYSISKTFSKFLCIQFLIRNKNILNEDINFIYAYKLMLSGIYELKFGN